MEVLDLRTERHSPSWTLLRCARKAYPRRLVVRYGAVAVEVQRTETSRHAAEFLSRNLAILVAVEPLQKLGGAYPSRTLTRRRGGTRCLFLPDA